MSALAGLFLMLGSESIDPSTKTYLQIVIVRKKTDSFCTIAELKRFSTVSGTNRPQLYQKIQNEVETAYPFGNNRPYQDPPTVKLVSEDEHAIVTHGTKRYESYKCESIILGAHTGKSYEQVISDAEAHAREWKISGSTVIKRWPLPTVGENNP